MNNNVMIGAVKKDYSYYEKRSIAPGRKAILKDIYGSSIANKKVTIVKALPKLGNYWQVKYGRNTFAVHGNDLDRVIVSRK